MINLLLKLLDEAAIIFLLLLPVRLLALTDRHRYVGHLHHFQLILLVDFCDDLVHLFDLLLFGPQAPRKLLDLLAIQVVVPLEDFMLSLAYRSLLLLAVLQKLDIAPQGVLEQLCLALEKDGLLVGHSDLLLQVELLALHVVRKLLGILNFTVDLSTLVVQLGLVCESLADLLL